MGSPKTGSRQFDYGKPLNGLRQAHCRQGKYRAFTRLDLCVSITSAILVIILVLFNLLGERGRILRCTHNLKKMGQAFHGYAGEHEGAFPPASSLLTGTSWDTAIKPYLRPDLFKTNSTYAKRELDREVAASFLCPSDNVHRPRPRTYSMSGHDMLPQNWPPGPDNATGVGLVWDIKTVNTLFGEDGWERATKNRSFLPSVKLSDVPDPANTLLLTENVMPQNQVGGILGATVRGVRQQVMGFNGNREQFHHGCFNYLMADGHVELLSPFKIGNAGSYDSIVPGDIWTIKAGD